MSDLNICEYHACDEFIERREGESNSNYKRRKTHSTACAQAMRDEGKLMKRGLMAAQKPKLDAYDYFNFGISMK